MENHRIVHRLYSIYAPYAHSPASTFRDEVLWPEGEPLSAPPPEYAKLTVVEKALDAGIALRSKEWAILLQRQRIYKVGKITLKSFWRSIEKLEDSGTTEIRASQ